MTQKNYLYVLLILVLFACSKKDTTTTPAKSTAKSVSSFSFSSLNPVVNATIDSVQHTITATLPIGTDASKLVPTIVVSSMATIAPLSGVAQDFTKPVTYTVTAEDGTTQTYTVKVTVTKSSAKSIKSFTFSALNPVVTATIDSVKNTITATLPAGTDLTKLVPTISISDRATVSPASGVAQDFSKAVTYTVTAEDGSVRSYVANISIVKSSEKIIKSFSFNSLSPIVTATIDSANKVIKATLPSGTNLTSLVPTIVVSNGATISPSSGIVQNFTNPVTYTVTAENGSKQAFIATITAGSTISDQTAMGKITATQTFILKTALCRYDSFSKDYDIELYDVTTVNCSNDGINFPPIDFTIPKLEVGTYTGTGPFFYLGNSRTVSYFGCDVIITKVTATSIEGKVRGGDNNGNQYIEGSFVATICK